MSEWSPESWQAKPARQQPEYPDQAALREVLTQLSDLPPLVTSWEVEALKSQLAEAADGKRFLLQGGDCAESFSDCRSEIITNKLKILLQMSLVLVHGTRRRIVRVGRIAGQYAKPRSENTETQGSETLPTYRGDLVNKAEFEATRRTPDPNLLLRGYERAALTLNFIRALIDGGFADLHHPEFWDLHWVEHSPLAKDYQAMVSSIGESLRFMEVLAGDQLGELGRVDFYTSHEGLHLLYEQASTRKVPHREGWYNLSTHMPWIGMRTLVRNEAHVEYFRGICNPLGLKVGSAMSGEELLRILDALDPQREPGRITVVHRFGQEHIAKDLPPLIQAVEKAGRQVLWCCDPMHGNTTKTASGVKTRRFDAVQAELQQAFELHEANNSQLGGVHVELTGENVTECVGGARGLTEEDLTRQYTSQVDPRLNYEQALELAMTIAHRS